MKGFITVSDGVSDHLISTAHIVAVNDMDKVENRGGKRVRCGRKSIRPSEKRVQTTISVAPETRDKIRFLAKKKNIRIGRIIDQVVDEIYNSDK